MTVDQAAPQESLTEVVSIRVTASEKAAIRLIAVADGDMTESEVLRTFIDSARLRAEGERLRGKLVA